ncbi:unnamed protein product [Caenorhabditis bovis]|uniref:Uncharacterized protein n=1 Tax=Caenorhabditis bovis TaxID=2654633 RepID=A0A8S1F7W0_9PELO|nr:unnamed protein product [Caenorhabditis bovis]
MKCGSMNTGTSTILAAIAILFTCRFIIVSILQVKRRYAHLWEELLLRRCESIVDYGLAILKFITNFDDHLKYSSNPSARNFPLVLHGDGDGVGVGGDGGASRKVMPDRQVKCFCDRDSCDDNLLCHGEFCFIGLYRNDDGDVPRLRQHCGTADDLPFLNRHVACQERVEQWQEVCRCTDDFCNTFAFLRSSIDTRQDPQDLVQFTKQDQPYPNVPEHRSHDVIVRQQSSSLIILLVIIPLSVGGFAVCLIFLNYHCKMC